MRRTVLNMVKEYTYTIGHKNDYFRLTLYCAGNYSLIIENFHRHIIKLIPRTYYPHRENGC